MSEISFWRYPVDILMPTAIRRAQNLLLQHLADADMSEYAELQSDGQLASQFDQFAAADHFDALREEALESMREDDCAGRELIRVHYNDRGSPFHGGALDRNTVGRIERRWTAAMEVQPALIGVWGLSYPLMVHYLDGSKGWETRCEAIAVIGRCKFWSAKSTIKSLISAGASLDSPSSGWAGHIQTANTELAKLFAPLMWDGGRAVKWHQRPDGSAHLTEKMLDDEDRPELLLALSRASMTDRIIKLRRTGTTA